MSYHNCASAEGPHWRIKGNVLATARKNTSLLYGMYDDSIRLSAIAPFATASAAMNTSRANRVPIEPATIAVAIDAIDHVTLNTGTTRRITADADGVYGTVAMAIAARTSGVESNRTSLHAVESRTAANASAIGGIR